MSAAAWLVDKSALARLHATPDRDLWASRIDRGLVRVTTVTLLEVGWSARTPAAMRQERRTSPLAAMPVEYLSPHVEDRALEVQARLAEEGRHRSAAIPDLLVAAAAELTRATVLHVDRHFELIAAITSQPIETLRLES